MSAGKLRFCRHPDGGTTACESSFFEDRRYGLMYGETRMPDGRVLWTPEAAAEAHLCSYCSAHVPTNQERRLAAMVDHPAGKDTQAIA